MGRCETCKYWKQDPDTIYFYNENFGECTHKKVINLEEIYCSEEKHEKYNNYDVIYSTDIGEVAELKVNKEYGCINYKEK